MTADCEDATELRPLLFSIAYRMLGSVADAEDMVQAAYVRYFDYCARGQRVESSRALLTTITTRLAIDALRSARQQRESYIGPWLPEPLLTSEESDVADAAATSDSLSMAFLVLLETLSPVERAVFLLREVFVYDYDEIARVVGKSAANCRQLLVAPVGTWTVDVDGSLPTQHSVRLCPRDSSTWPSTARSGLLSRCSPRMWCSTVTAAAQDEECASRCSVVTVCNGSSTESSTRTAVSAPGSSGAGQRRPRRCLSSIRLAA